MPPLHGRPAPGPPVRRLYPILLLAVLAGAAAPPLPAPLTRSPANANYRIEARLDAEAKTLQGTMVLTWTNLQTRPAEELWFHLYWNGWRNNSSTWMLEDRIRGRSSRGNQVEDEDWSFQVVDRVLFTPAPAPGASAEAVDLSRSLEYRAPDDGNAQDRTLARLPLPSLVPPGATVEVRLDWHARIPRTFARTGYRGDFFFIAHWFPKLAVYGPGGWNRHQFHSGTEFFSDFGTYDVTLDLPEGFVVGATGTPREVEQGGLEPGRRRHRYLQDDVHGFAWTASPDFRERRARFEHPGLPTVEMRLLYQPEHEDQAERHFDATRAAIRTFGEWYGPYPYGHVTIVDPAYGSGAGGMEYPTLFTAGTRLFNPFGGGRPEGVTIHEMGHQFFYGVVANNEFEHAWIDEGLTSFADARTYDDAYGDEFHVERYLPLRPKGRGALAWLFEDIRYGRDVHGNRMHRFRKAPNYDAPAKPTYLYHPRAGARVSYDKTALWLATLERHLGWETLREILSTFYTTYAYRHPTPEDFFQVADQVAGQDLSWFFDQVYRSTVTFDYAIDRAKSTRLRRQGYFGPEDALALAGEASDADGAEETLYRSEAVVRRLGEGVFPVEILLSFDDGREVRHDWDGADGWKLFVEEGPAQLVKVEVDPDRLLLLDLDRTNNSALVKSRPALPAAKWGGKWLLWFQDLLLTYGAFV